MAFFQVSSKLLRWFRCLKRVTFNCLEIIAQFLSCHQSRKCSRKRHTASFMNISHLMRFSMTVSTDFENITQHELAALELVDRIHKQIDENKIPFSVFLDLSKAFDTLDHDILLHKLQYYGITGTALDWFRSYLTERYQYVDYNGASSSMKLLTTGVPQGSILGPLLFIIYMNDIHTVSNNLNFILYADDTTLTSPLCSFTYGGYHDINRVSKIINSEITKISEWLSVNK